MIKVAASAASPKTKIQESQGSQRMTARLAGDGNGYATLDSWILVFAEAALAPDLVTARKFSHFVCHVPPLSTLFWTLQYRNVSFLATGKSLYPHL